MILKATSLLETIVASVVFLIVFGMAMSSVIHLQKMKAPDWASIEEDFNEFVRRVPENGKAYEYEWGQIETACDEYRDVPGLLHIHATIRLKDGRKTIYRYLQCDDTN